MSVKSIIERSSPAWLRPHLGSLYLGLRRIDRQFGRPVDKRRRLKFAMAYVQPQVDLAKSWALSDSESSNFLYALTPLSRLSLAHTIATVFGVTPALVRSLFEEIENDEIFQKHVAQSLKALLPGVSSFSIGRRLGWYAVARIMKPATIVETGVDYGLGSCVLCVALLRNAGEGSPGRYIGIELRTGAGQIFTAPFNTVGEIRYGDSLESLGKLAGPIDLFINDSDHSMDYEAREYEAIRAKLSDRSVILGDNAHCSPSLADFSERSGRNFIFFKEEPAAHWYPGAGIGFSFHPGLSGNR